MYCKLLPEFESAGIESIKKYVMNDEESQFIKEFSEKNDVEIHVHAPYYINLAGDDEEINMSFEKIKNSALMADKMGAKTVVIHPGFYGENSEKKTVKKIIKNTKKLTGILKKEKIKTKIGIETMGKQKVFGTIDEIVEVCTNVKNVIPVLDMGHIHARCNGCLKKRKDFEEIFAVSQKSLRVQLSS